MNAQSIIPPNIDYGKISADKYSPDETYEAGDLRIQYNSLWKANQKISVPEPWTPDHWDPTTLAAELSAVNSSMLEIVSINKTASITSTGQNQDTGVTVDIPPNAYFCITASAIFANSTAIWVGLSGDGNINNCIANANTGKNHASCTYSGVTTVNKTYHVFARWSGTAENQIQLTGFYITKKS